MVGDKLPECHRIFLRQLKAFFLRLFRFAFIKRNSISFFAFSFYLFISFIGRLSAWNRCSARSEVKESSNTRAPRAILPHGCNPSGPSGVSKKKFVYLFIWFFLVIFLLNSYFSEDLVRIRLDRFGSAEWFKSIKRAINCNLLRWMMQIRQSNRCW